MEKIGNDIPHLIDQAIDFMASTQAFREYLKKLPPVTQFRPIFLRKTCRYIYNVWNIIASFTGQSR
uniref:Cytoplasmic protein n=1 Tax=Escherichia coli TaxID=562 RepID=A0A649US10_ECOLX|nr:hypothetical protein [Escherichia coli]